MPATTTFPPDALAALERDILATIPLARAMGLSVTGGADGALTLTAPLDPNINDKGCAFGGSLVGLMTLAGWGLLRLALAVRGRTACDIYVVDSMVRYLAPVRETLKAVARFDGGTRPDAILDDLDTRGKARARVHCEIIAGGQPAAVLDAAFVALRRAGNGEPEPRP